MGVNRYAARRDGNEGEIKAALKAINASVVKLSAKGVGDLLVGWQGFNFLLETKQRKGKLTPSQLEFIEAWQGQYTVVRTAEEALDVVMKGVQA